MLGPVDPDPEELPDEPDVDVEAPACIFRSAQLRNLICLNDFVPALCKFQVVHCHFRRTACSQAGISSYYQNVMQWAQPENLLAAAALETSWALEDAVAAPLDVADAATLGRWPAAAAEPSAECLAAAAQHTAIFFIFPWGKCRGTYSCDSMCST